MAELIDDMLELSRVSRTDLRPRNVDLSAEARLIAEELHRREPDRRVEVVIQDGIQAEADAGLMKIALENLLGNAWKFTRKAQGARIEFAASEDGGATVYEVRDNGAGFNMAYADRLFRPFRRLHGEAEFPGTGIGLATVHRVIDRHGGRVWATGAVDKGASLFFTLGKAQESRK